LKSVEEDKTIIRKADIAKVTILPKLLWPWPWR